MAGVGGAGSAGGARELERPDSGAPDVAAGSSAGGSAASPSETVPAEAPGGSPAGEPATRPAALARRSDPLIGAILEGECARTVRREARIDRSRYPDVIDIADVAGSPAGRAALRKVLSRVAAETGGALEPRDVEQVVRDPGRLLDKTTVSVGELVRAFRTAGTARRSGIVAPDVPEDPPKLGSSFDLGRLDDPPAAVSGEVPPLRDLGEGLFHGDEPAGLDPKDVRRRRALAETFDRPSTGGDGFEVKYAGKTHRDLPSLLRAAAADGHEVEVRIEQAAANFGDLHVKGPDGKLRDVATPLWVRSGVRDARGEEAIIPAPHSGLEISIRATDRTRGPRLDGELSFDQGPGGIRFYPAGLTKGQSWVGGRVLETWKGDKAIEALSIASRWRGAVVEAAREGRLPAGGYGTTGVCNDSAAVIQHALTGRTTIYPLTMQDDAVVPVLRRRIERSADPIDRTLIRTVEALPSDDRPDGTAAARALASIAYASDERTPWRRADNARRILEGVE